MLYLCHCLPYVRNRIKYTKIETLPILRCYCVMFVGKLFIAMSIQNHSKWGVFKCTKREMQRTEMCVLFSKLIYMEIQCIKKLVALQSRTFNAIQEMSNNLS